MTKIKGRYVALIETNFEFQKESGMRTIEEMHEAITNGELDNEISKEVSEIFDNNPIKITRQYFDIYEVEENE